MLDQKARWAWDIVMRPIGALLRKAGVSPNSITVGGLLVQIGVAVLIVQGRLLPAAAVAVAAALADGLDGAVAKAIGRPSPFGALLDSTTDRASDALYFLPLAWLYGVEPDIAERDDPRIAALAMIAMTLSFLVPYIRARAEGLGYDCKVGIAERAERTIIMILGLALDLVPLALVVLTVLSFITTFQRLFHVRKQVLAERQ